MPAMTTLNFQQTEFGTEIDICKCCEMFLKLNGDRKKIIHFLFFFSVTTRSCVWNVEYFLLVTT